MKTSLILPFLVLVTLPPAQAARNPGDRANPQVGFHDGSGRSKPILADRLEASRQGHYDCARRPKSSLRPLWSVRSPSIPAGVTPSSTEKQCKPASSLDYSSAARPTRLPSRQSRMAMSSSCAAMRSSSFRFAANSINELTASVPGSFGKTACRSRPFSPA